ncbi:MAG: NADAR family protein, partial [Bdellovibrionaceae bacterium]|nr:NADAR family protein [Pseudobdellovibrionaceae bacterium]
ADRSKGEVILSKRNELGQFSNLAAAPFVMDGIKYASVEGLWQGMKYPENANDERLKDPSVVWPYSREQVYAMSGFESKTAGDLANVNMKKLGIKWITYRGEKVEYNGSGVQRHYQIILNASRAKIAQNPNLKKLLLSTGDLKFLPDHTQQPNPNPAYLYFDIYLKIRSEIK